MLFVSPQHEDPISVVADSGHLVFTGAGGRIFVWKRAKLVNTYIDPAHIEENAEGNKKV
jgi:hypothetical protein